MAGGLQMCQKGVIFKIKCLIFYLLLTIRQVQNVFKLKMRSSDVGYGIKSRSSIEEMDCRQPLSNHPKAIDAVYFNLANGSGWHLVAGIAHRPHGVVNGFLILKVPKIGVLITPKMPDTLLFGTETEKYGAEGLIMYPFSPMRVWKIEFSGKMQLHGNPEKTYNVTLNSIWNSGLPYFDFDTDMDKWSVAKSLALEPWSREYFDDLKRFHQTHYEQHGDAHVQVLVDGEAYSAKVSGVRDHSYGEKREWKSFYRYVLHFITLENGLRISVGVVCTPTTFSRMVLGYVYLTSGEVIPIQECSLELRQHGECGSPPTDYGFSFTAGNEVYNVQVNVNDAPEFYIGWEWEARIVEQLASFKVNGVYGFGAAEWEYRYLNGRPEYFSGGSPQFEAASSAA